MKDNQYGQIQIENKCKVVTRTFEMSIVSDAMKQHLQVIFAQYCVKCMLNRLRKYSI